MQLLLRLLSDSPRIFHDTHYNFTKTWQDDRRALSGLRCSKVCTNQGAMACSCPHVVAREVRLLMMIDGLDARLDALGNNFEEDEAIVMRVTIDPSQATFSLSRSSGRPLVEICQPRGESGPITLKDDSTRAIDISKSTDWGYICFVRQKVQEHVQERKTVHGLGIIQMDDEIFLVSTTSDE